MDNLYRHWLILRMLPRYPQKIDGATIEARLREEGFATTTRRTIQRDLEKLSEMFPIGSDERSKPFGWYWTREAPAFAMPGMDPATALTFHLAGHFLAPLFPPSTMNTLQPYLAAARQVLDKLTENRLTRWPEKVRIISRGQPLGAPEVKREVADVIYEALLQERRFRTSYRKRGESAASEYVVNPLGLVIQEQLTYLVATLWDYDNVIFLALHRMESAELLDELCRVPDGFDLQAYLDSSPLQFPEGDQPLKLEVLFDAEAGAHLRETPLSGDQTITKRQDERLLIKATVADTAQLRWWLLGFGEKVEVAKPKKLREEFAAVADRMSNCYKVTNNPPLAAKPGHLPS